MTADLRLGDALEVLRGLPDGLARTCVTSPPYWGLRDYGVDGQLGLEAAPDEYVRALVAVFREVRRVLADDGTLWLNLGDSYVGARRDAIGATTLDGSRRNQEASRVAQRAMTASRRRDDEPIPRSDTAVDGLKPKDMVGIPWRVALALQQPYYAGAIPDERDRTWLAALLDSEGTFTILSTTSPHGSGNSYPPIVQVRMTSEAVVQKAASLIGVASPAQYPPSNRGNRAVYQWRLSGARAAGIAREMYPYLIEKRKQALIAWNHQAVRDSYETKRGVAIPAAALAKHRVCRDLIRRLNHGEDADVPSWMVEPPSMTEPGWYLRSDVIWSKPNPMPESVTDRPTKAHEYLFLLSKSERYYYDAEAIREQAGWDPNDTKRPDGWASHEGGHGSFHRDGREKGARVRRSGNVARKHGDERGRPGSHRGASIPWEGSTRNKRSVWTVAARPFPDAHFATYPPELIRPCVLAGSEPGDLVLDPFNGAGTTGLVALQHGRNYVGIELNPEYVAMTEQRLAPLLAQPRLLDAAR